MMPDIANRRNIIIVVLLALALFLVWRLIRPMDIFIGDDRFVWPIDTSQAAAPLITLSAEECGTCHQEIYKEWNTTIHSQAWTDTYFQTDFKFDGEKYVCRTCHTPLDRQLPELAVDYVDKEKLKPVLVKNPDFDAKLQHEGVTCAACHYRNGKIQGVLGLGDEVHPVEKLDSPNRVCMRCHVVSGERWDTFFAFPPCGTVAEIETSKGKDYQEETWSMSTEVVDALGCVNCHMPVKERALVPGGKVYPTRQHLWRGGHDPNMVKNALTISFDPSADMDSYTLSITNTGADHYVPTGTPDRHLIVRLRVLDAEENVLDEDQNKLVRTVMWRPVILDLRDTRLPPNELRQYSIDIKPSYKSQARFVEADVRYYLVDKRRLRRIGYEGDEILNYEVYRKRLVINNS